MKPFIEVRIGRKYGRGLLIQKENPLADGKPVHYYQTRLGETNSTKGPAIYLIAGVWEVDLNGDFMRCPQKKVYGAEPEECLKSLVEARG